MTPQLTTLNDPHSAAAEAYQSLRTSLEFSRLGTRRRDPVADGRRQHAAQEQRGDANLAVVMAQAGDRVMLGRRRSAPPPAARDFWAAESAGATTWLRISGQPPLQRTVVEGLQVLVGRARAGNPVALLSSKRLADGWRSCGSTPTIFWWMRRRCWP